MRVHLTALGAVLISAACSNGAAGIQQESPSTAASGPVTVEDQVTIEVQLPRRLSDERVLLQTSLGEIMIALYPDVAPNHVEQFLKLVRLGVYDTTQFYKVTPGFVAQTAYPHTRSGTPLSSDQEAAIVPLKAEFSELTYRRGSVFMALNDNDDPDSGQASFFIVLSDTARLHGRYTIFGEVTVGFDVLDRFALAPRDERNVLLEPIEIRTAEIVVR